MGKKGEKDEKTEDANINENYTYTKNYILWKMNAVSAISLGSKSAHCITLTIISLLSFAFASENTVYRAVGYTHFNNT